MNKEICFISRPGDGLSYCCFQSEPNPKKEGRRSRRPLKSGCGGLLLLISVPDPSSNASNECVTRCIKIYLIACLNWTALPTH